MDTPIAHNSKPFPGQYLMVMGHCLDRVLSCHGPWWQLMTIYHQGMLRWDNAMLWKCYQLLFGLQKIKHKFISSNHKMWKFFQKKNADKSILCRGLHLRIHTKIYTHEICTYFYHAMSCGYQLFQIHMVNLPIFFKVASLALGQSCDCPSAREATLKNMGKINYYHTQQNTTHVHILWDVLQESCREYISCVQEMPRCNIKQATMVIHQPKNTVCPVANPTGGLFNIKYHITSLGKPIVGFRCP